MELTERVPLKPIYWLSKLSYTEFVEKCLNKNKKYTQKECKTKYSILQQFCKTNLKTKGIVKRIYSYSKATSGRLFSGGSLQGLPSKIRGLFMRDGVGTDIDMCNAHPVILRYICKLHDIPCPHLEYYVNHREECLKLFESREIGKNIYLAALNKDTLTRAKGMSEEFKNYDVEIKQIQQQLIEITEYNEIAGTVPDNKDYNKLGSVINRIMCHYENLILQHAIHVINEKGIEIAILMFDGLMVYGDYYKDKGLLLEITQYVENKMPGLDMKWAYKEHNNELHITGDKDNIMDTKSITTETDTEKTLFKNPVGLLTPEQYQISIDDLSDAYRVTEIISNTLKETLVLCGEHWYMLTDDQLWSQQNECSMYVVKEVRKYIDESNKRTVEQIAVSEGDVKQKLIEKSEAYLKGYKDTLKPAFLNILIKLLKTELRDDKFADKLDVLIGKLAFRNGVVDLETKEFRAGIRFDDYITDTIPYDYKPEMLMNPEHLEGHRKKTEELKGHLLKILNNNPEHLEYFLSIIGFSFIGIPHKEKSIYFCVDKTTTHKGDNGKSFYFDILETLLPCYAYKTNKSFLEADNQKSHKQFVKMKGKRLVFADEFEEKGVDEERIKIVAEGSKAENEVMYGTSEHINILFKMFVLTNKCPNVKGEAVYNRYKQISYGSHFDRTGERLEACPERLEFIADTDLGDKIKSEYQNEVFGLIIEYANKYYTNKFKLPAIPEQFKQDAQYTKKQNDVFALWFEEHCSVGEGKIPKELLIKLTNMSEKLVKEGMAQLGFTYDKDLKGMGKNPATDKYYKGGWFGCYINVDNDVELDG